MTSRNITPPCERYYSEDSRDIFFSEFEDEQLEAKEVCAKCPLIERCLEMALETGCEYGIFGGTTPQERGMVR